jgi:hypothetical protein
MHDRRQPGRLQKRDNLLMGEGGEAKSYDVEKALSSINHSILPVLPSLLEFILSVQKVCFATFAWSSWQEGGRRWSQIIRQQKCVVFFPPTELHTILSVHAFTVGDKLGPTYLHDHPRQQ